MYLISPDRKQYRANLHCHSTHSDGKKTPEQLKEMYKSRGYSVLSITDHETPNDHSRLSDKDFIMLTGYEAYIRKYPDCRYDAYDREIHINLFARDPHNTAMVCYNPSYCKYMSDEAKERYVKVGPTDPREYSVEYINKFVRTAKENGFIAAYNHPVWSMEAEEDILGYEGFFSMEMCNYSSYLINHLEYNAALYDKLLCLGKHIACHGADDNHNVAPEDSPGCDSFGAFAMIMADELTYDSIFSAMEKGEMYSSMGPLFREISAENGKIHVECSEVERITLFTGSKSPKSVIAPTDGSITSADFEIDPRAKFIRISATDRYGRAADTRGYFPQELC